MQAELLKAIQRIPLNGFPYEALPTRDINEIQGEALTKRKSPSLAPKTYR